jgi:hypothetical protein
MAVCLLYVWYSKTATVTYSIIIIIMIDRHLSVYNQKSSAEIHDRKNVGRQTKKLIKNIFPYIKKKIEEGSNNRNSTKERRETFEGFFFLLFFLFGRGFSSTCCACSPSCCWACCSGSSSCCNSNWRRF